MWAGARNTQEETDLQLVPPEHLGSSSHILTTDLHSSQGEGYNQHGKEPKWDLNLWTQHFIKEIPTEMSSKIKGNFIV